jgi:hypothetical protein
MNLSEKQKHVEPNINYNLGKREIDNNDIDPANTDAFYSLNPAKI